MPEGTPNDRVGNVEDKPVIRRKLRVLGAVLAGMFLLLTVYAGHVKTKPKEERFIPDMSWMPRPLRKFSSNVWVWWNDGFADEGKGFFEPAEPQPFFYWPTDLQYLPTSPEYIPERMKAYKEWQEANPNLWPLEGYYYVRNDRWMKWADGAWHPREAPSVPK